MQQESMINMSKFMLQFAWFAVYLFSVSASPPLLIGLPGDNMLILMSWKLQITLLTFSPLVIFELKRLSPLEISYRPKYVKKFFHMLIASIMYLIWLYGLLEA